MNPPPHPIFDEFQRYIGPVKEGGIVIDFLGTTVRREFVQSWIPPSTTPQVETSYPPPNEDIFAWIDLLTAVTTAHDTFTMMELGAGYGLWSVRAAKAVEQRRQIPIKIIAVEAEPQHFAWLKLHFRDNGIDPSSHTLIEAAVSDASGTALFYVASPDAEASKPNEWWGQSLIQDHEAVDIVTEDSGRGRPVAVLKSGWQSVEVSKIAMRDLLRNCDLIDFVHVDIQREELPAIRSSIDVLDEKVKYLHIGTHSEEIERGLRAILQEHGWQCRADYPGNGKRHTTFGELEFIDGVQSWANPRLVRGLTNGGRSVERIHLRGSAAESQNAGMASQTRSRAGDLGRNNFIEVPGAFRIENALHVYDRAEVEYDSNVLSVVTSPEPWSYATIIPVEPEAAESICSDRPAVLEVEAYVDSGELGFGAVHQDCHQIAGEKLIKAAPGILQALDIYVPRMGGYIGLLCRNGGLDNTRSKGRILRAKLSLAPDSASPEQTPCDVFAGTGLENLDNNVTNNLAANRSPFSLARACWNQRAVLAHLKPRISAFHEAVADPTSLFLFQYAQLTATALEFQPDLILELGRGYGNSTCAFTEVANRLGGTRVLSLDQWGSNWERTVSRLHPIVSASWFRPLQAFQANILTFDFRAALGDARRVLLFWDAHGFEVASVVLGKLLPELAKREHLILMHDMCDLRYQSPESLSYGDNELWTGGNNTSRHVKIGFIDSNVEQAVAILDFSTRNRLPLHSADHSLHSELTDTEANELAHLWGDLFSRYGHWIYFSLSESPGKLTFPKPPVQPASDAAKGV